MTTPIHPSIIDDQIAECQSSVPPDRILLAFKGRTMQEAMLQAELAFIENPQAWSERQYWCGEWTISYQIRV